MTPTETRILEKVGIRGQMQHLGAMVDGKVKRVFCEMGHSSDVARHFGLEQETVRAVCKPNLHKAIGA